MEAVRDETTPRGLSSLHYTRAGLLIPTTDYSSPFSPLVFLFPFSSSLPLPPSSPDFTMFSGSTRIPAR
jgi:hypothetical protein